MTKSELTHGEIVALLAKRHSKDVFVPECKTGPTWYGNPIRLDAWAMPRSWAHWDTWGYEVKASRADFLQDDKWPRYLDYCHHFAFVCPWEMIKVSEVPEGAGLIWVTSGGHRLHTKVKAPRREIEVPAELLIYILMSRTVVCGRLMDDGIPHGADRERSLAYWREWLVQKEESREIGYRVSSALAARVAQADSDLRVAKTMMERVGGVDKELQEQLGISLNELAGWGSVRAGRLQDAATGVPDSLLRDMAELERRLERTRKALETIRNGGQDGEAA